MAEPSVSPHRAQPHQRYPLTKLSACALTIGAIWWIWSNQNVSQMWAFSSNYALNFVGGQKLASRLWTKVYEISGRVGKSL